MASNVETESLPAGVYSDGERLWRAKVGATSTFEDNIAAHELFMDLHHDEFWNPWRMEAQAEDLEHAQAVMEEWERAEPSFRRITKRQVQAQMARWDREWKKRSEKAETDRLTNLERFDSAREEARLKLLERRCILKQKQAEVAGLRSGESSPAMDSKRRAPLIAGVDDAIGRHEATVHELEPLVGDPEDVPDATGHLPQDRRTSSLHRYQQRRVEEVRTLQKELSELEEQLNATSDRTERSKIRSTREAQKWHLDKLLAVSRQEAEDMCADCALPAFQHGYVTPPFVRPCPAWPGQRAIHAEMRAMLETFSRQRKADQAQPSPPEPKPLAVIPSKLPIQKVVERLQELQKDFPDAEVRRGRAKRWELWPTKNDKR